MAVGAGSIRRASKLSAEVTESTKKQAETKVPVEKTKETKKSTEVKKSATKKPTTKKATGNNTKIDTKVLQNTANKVYHITEELPIYLL